MRAVVQRVSQASVTVDERVVGAIEEPGLVVLVGVTHTDTPELAAKLAAKLWHLRILDGEKSCSDVVAPLLVISQFTLHADTRKGRPAVVAGCRPRPRGRALGRCSGHRFARVGCPGGDRRVRCRYEGEPG